MERYSEISNVGIDAIFVNIQRFAGQKKWLAGFIITLNGDHKYHICVSPLSIYFNV